MLSAEVVTADGWFLKTSEEENEDLFWGLRFRTSARPHAVKSLLWIKRNPSYNYRKEMPRRAYSHPEHEPREEPFD